MSKKGAAPVSESINQSNNAADSRNLYLPALSLHMRFKLHTTLKTGFFFKIELKILRMNNRPSLLLTDDNFAISTGNEIDEVEQFRFVDFFFSKRVFTLGQNDPFRL